MIKINDYATKNHFNEWEIKDLPESENYVLKLDGGDLTPMLYALSLLPRDSSLYLPYIPSIANLLWIKKIMLNLCLINIL